MRVAFVPEVHTPPPFTTRHSWPLVLRARADPLLLQRRQGQDGQVLGAGTQARLPLCQHKRQRCGSAQDGDKFEEILALPGHHAEVWALCVSADGETVVTGGNDRSIRTWQRTEEQVRSHLALWPWVVKRA